MKISAKESTSKIVVIGVFIVIFFALLLNFSYRLIDKMGIAKNTIFPLLIISVIIIYQFWEFAILYASENYELVLEDKFIRYKSHFINCTIQYKEIRKMKIAKHMLGRFGGYKYLLIIKTGRLNNIYISRNSIKAKQFNALKTILINKTGKGIIDKRKN